MAVSEAQVRSFRKRLIALGPPEKVLARFDSITTMALLIENEDRLEDMLAEACREANWTVPWETDGIKLTFRACLIDSDHPEHHSDTEGDNTPEIEQAYRRGFSQGIAHARQILGQSYDSDHPVAIEERRVYRWRRARLQSRQQKFFGQIEPDYPCLIRETIRRSGLSPSLRYRILERDMFRCTICGASAATGAVLEVDHIVAVAKGGPDEESNLRVLCFDCNRGKGAS